jgi:RHS repeat-associated protein
LVTPILAQVPDGDLNHDGLLDEADALLGLRIAEGSLTPTAEQAIRGDVAPLEAAPDGANNLGDALLLLRAIESVDVDGDGLSTQAELANGASPFQADTDGDGVSDADEIAQQTNPTEADTDGDGLEDGAELPADRRRGIGYQHTDHLGSTAILLKPDGSIARRLVYEPYGKAVAPTASSDAKVPTFGFTGQRFEQGLGLYDYGARWYDPELGRFLQPDPIVPQPFDPQSLNRTSYVLNNPLARIDPSGNTPAVVPVIVGVLKVADAIDTGITLVRAAAGDPTAQAEIAIDGAMGFAAKRLAPGGGLAGKFLRWLSRNGDDVKDAEKAKSAAETASKRLHRPHVRKRTKEAVAAGQERDAQGQFISPYTLQSVGEKPDLAHKPGREFWRERAQAERDGISQREFNEMQNDPDLYYYENPRVNRSHQLEDKRPSADSDDRIRPARDNRGGAAGGRPTNRDSKREQRRPTSSR